jgi:hypothetical protein
MSRENTKQCDSFSVEYPSGRSLVLAGRLEVGVLGGESVIPGVVRTNGDVVLLDPRALITCSIHREQIVYNPRDVPLDEFSPEMRDWLIDHPSWPGRRR